MKRAVKSGFGRAGPGGARPRKLTLPLTAPAPASTRHWAHRVHRWQVRVPEGVISDRQQVERRIQERRCERLTTERPQADRNPPT